MVINYDDGGLFVYDWGKNIMQRMMVSGPGVVEGKCVFAMMRSSLLFKSVNRVGI